MSNSRTQIIATLGPSSNTSEIIRDMIEHNMDVVRLNFSWGTHEEHAQFMMNVRNEANDLDKKIPIIADLSGPRVQIGKEHEFGGTEGSIITDKDREDLEFVLDQDVEYVAMSYVGNGDDIDELRSLIKKQKGKAKIIAKIERKEAVDNISEIVDKSDAIMVARGDLGKALPIEKIPFVQNEIIKAANKKNKPVIVATEMMSSMIDDDEPTRSDVTDVAYAVINDADAVMLSNETAVGENPVEVIKTMEKVVQEAEKHELEDSSNLL